MAEQGMKVHEAVLLDIGTSGARSFHPDGAAIPPNDQFAATIITKNGCVPCMAEIRSRRYTPRGLELGLKVTAEDPNALAEIVLNTLFPQVRSRRMVPLPELERLFKESGYLHLREGCEPNDLWAKMDADAITRDLVYVAKDGEAIAHGSVTRAYRNTWLGHQTAMRSNHPEAARARRVLTTMTMITSLLEGRQGRLIAYYDPSKPYGRIFFDRFAKSVQSPDLAVITDMDWFERDPAPLTLDTVIPPTISVSRAERPDLSIVTELARRQLPALHADAIDLHPSLLRSSALHPAYRSSALHRGREVFVVRIRDRIVGAALCEHTSPSLSLFNTLNLAQFFFVAPKVDARAQLALQHAVRQFYAECGIQDPFVVAPCDTFDPTLDPHTRLEMKIACITWSFEGIRAYENYVRLRCAWLEQGRRPRLKRRSSEHVDSNAHGV
jgi:hypothetical protein